LRNLAVLKYSKAPRLEFGENPRASLGPDFFRNLLGVAAGGYAMASRTGSYPVGGWAGEPMRAG